MSFLNPLILLGLLGLPLLWWILRITPPLPKHVVFPPLRFLKDLTTAQQTPRHTPWWILLLRVLIVALTIIALARPVSHLSDALSGQGTLRLIIDNDWASAQTWDHQMETAKTILTQAEYEGRNIQIYTTALKPDMANVMSAAQARAYLQTLEPLPWFSDYRALADHLKNHPAQTSLWLGHGLAGKGFRYLANTMESQGTLRYFTPPNESLPVSLYREKENGLGLKASLHVTASVPDGTPYTIQAMDDKGAVLGQFPLVIDSPTDSITTQIDLPDGLRSDLSALRLLGVKGVGGRFILGMNARVKNVGILGPPSDVAPKPFIEARYYLARALENSHRVTSGSAQSLLESNPAVILVPDTGTLSIDTLNQLEDWVKQGGTLVRFSGPEMLASETAQALVPVPLRLSNRSMKGALTWDTPKKLAHFRNSLADLAVPDITVNTQVLAQPVSGLEDKTWAALEDGTPLITAGPLDKGLLVFVHTTASAQWSDLALSGTYVSILNRIVSLSGRAQATQENSTTPSLHPIWILDGWGRQKIADKTVQSIPTDSLEAVVINADHPPGLYGTNGIEKALNIGAHIDHLQTAHPNLPSATMIQIYAQTADRAYMPLLLSIALLLFFLDWVITLVAPLLTRIGRIKVLPTLLLLALLSFPAHAGQDIDYADGLYLAYIKTGNVAIDTLSQTGLESVASVLSRRTSAETRGVTAVDPERDSLTFFPLLYWPATGHARPLSPKALKNVQSYLDHGGTILIDTQNQRINQKILVTQLSGLRIPVMEPIGKDHVLKKSFYLLDRFPGRYIGGDFWVEQDSGDGRDGVSSVIIGSNDWASAWTQAAQRRTRQNELSLRFGVNLVMYALTGNYKADQVHLPHILERMGQ